MSTLFHYTVHFIPEDEELFKDCIVNGVVTESGVVVAKSYGKAAEKVTDFYGVENICDISLYECCDILCNDEIADMIQQDKNLEKG